MAAQRGFPRAASYFHISDNLDIKFDNNDKKGNLGSQWQSLISSPKVGQPGKYQGLNTGVVLMDLEKMRQSDFYNKETKLESMVTLHKSFLPSSDWGLGDQEWLTLLGWRNPSFIRQLPCQFNRQVTNTKGRERWMEYFSCKEKIKIMHLTPLW